MDKMSADFGMENDIYLQNNQPPMDLRMSSLKRNKPRPYSRLTKRVLEDLRKERAMAILSLIPSDKRKKIGLDLRPAERAQTLNTKKCGLLPTFPYLFWNVVKNETYRSVWWSKDGTAVVIHEMMFIAEILERDVTDHIFGTMNIKSVYRQLNQYGFTRPKFEHESHLNPSMDITGKQVKVFAHPYFQRGCGHLLAQVKRCKVTKASPVVEKSFKASRSGSEQSDQMISSACYRPAIPSTSPVRGSETESLLLASKQADLASKKPSMLDQIEALLRKAQAQQPPLTNEMALCVPGLTLPILLAALLNPGFR